MQKTLIWTATDDEMNALVALLCCVGRFGEVQHGQTHVLCDEVS